MARISFKGKIETIYNTDGSVAYRRVRVPAIERRHCDMPAFRCHAKFRAYANSDLFPGMLRRIRAERLGEYVRLDQVPPGVNVDTSRFLATVSIDV